MREVHDLAAGMKEAIAGIKKAAADAKSSLAVEISRAHVNAGKVQTMTSDLKSANLEVEEFLGESGSNFPPPGEELNTPPPLTADINGVTINSNVKK